MVADNFIIYYTAAPVDLQATSGPRRTINDMRLKYRTYYVEYNVNDVWKFACVLFFNLTTLLCSDCFVNIFALFSNHYRVLSCCPVCLSMISATKYHALST
jgi:hypothetical protein